MVLIGHTQGSPSLGPSPRWVEPNLPLAVGHGEVGSKCTSLARA